MGKSIHCLLSPSNSKRKRNVLNIETKLEILNCLAKRERGASLALIETSVQEESDPVDDETDEDEDNNNDKSSKGPSNAEAFSALETAMEWYKQQSECCPTQLLLL
ncbi:UNVERIFIED_CONTAM: hypothetical protein NCL1_47048 [Trichonephila clavipes]